MLVARVLPDVAGFDRELDYCVPGELSGSVHPGALVRIPLQGRRVGGWVTCYPAHPAHGVTLRPLARVTGWGPEPELLELATWAAWRWAGRRRALLVTASPDNAVKSLPRPTVPLCHARPPQARSLSPTLELLQEAWAPGVHLMRLPPAHSATDLVLAAAEHGPVLVVTATTARAEVGCAALRRRGALVALLPSEWANARGGASHIVIGSRAAAWGPCPGMASVVVLDAHDEALLQEQAPTWDSPTVAAERARRAGAPCFWVTPCPTVELLARADGLHVPARSVERAGWAPLSVVDSRHQDPRSGLYSRELVAVLKGEVAADRRVVCVLNRKGRAVLLDCAACGEPARCERCGAGLVQLEQDLVCRRCEARRPLVCASCGSDALRQLRVGVSRAREQLEALAGRPVAEVTASPGPLPEEALLVGTEAVLYRSGAGSPSLGPVGTVAFLDFDQELLAPRYRAAEQALALLARASRLVGGRSRQGKILVQTRAPDHPVLEAAQLADPGHLSRAEEPLRRALRLPPFAGLALLSGPGANELAATLSNLSSGPGEGAGEAPGQQSRGLEVTPLPAGRWVVRAGDYTSLADALAAAGRPAERVRVEVGPARF
jgi:primosomal protein N' (replication factor Y)